MAFGRARMVGDMSTSLSKFMDFNYSALRFLNFFGWSSPIFAFKCAVMQAKFETNCRKTLHSSRNGRIFQWMVESCNPLIAFAVCDVILMHRRQIICSK